LKFAAQEPHIWWGVSVEDRKHGLPRITSLRDAQAKVRFLSVEPLLEDLGTFSLDKIHWVIVGGESGVGARPLQREWVVSIRDQCKRARVPFFFKQWGGVQKKRTGRELDGSTYDSMPARVAKQAPSNAIRAKMIETANAASVRFAQFAEPIIRTPLRRKGA
ncbi:MAG TPA: DUF5131 family protein, partial [Casimicrobiaceae bacterium]